MKEFVKIMKAASDPTRVKTLKMLEKKMMCVCEILTGLVAAQSTTSKHLKILEEVGLIAYFKGGPQLNCLLDNLRHCLESDALAPSLLIPLPETYREAICGG